MPLPLALVAVDAFPAMDRKHLNGKCPALALHCQKSSHAIRRKLSCLKRPYFRFILYSENLVYPMLILIMTRKGSFLRVCQFRHCPTRRAVDLWDSARFSSSFLVSIFLLFRIESTPTHKPLTQTVGWPISTIYPPSKRLPLSRGVSNEI